MQNVAHIQQRRHGAVARHRHLSIGVALVIGVAVIVLYAAPAGADGAAANTISVKAAPSAGSPKGVYTPVATATSGDVVVVTLDSGSSGCSLSGGTVTFTGAGTCRVDFNDAGNAKFVAAPQVQQTITVDGQNLITTSKTPTAGSVGGRFAPGASATSGDPVRISVASAPSVCVMDGVWVDFRGHGSCKVDFNDPGNGPFGPALEVQRTVRVHASNVIHVGPPPAAGSINERYSPVATATSGDTVVVSLESTSTGCALSGGTVTFTGNGVCVIDFNDPGNGAFAAAATVRRSITIGYGNPVPQSPLVITSASIVAGRHLELVASGGSGDGTVTYAVVSAGTAHCALEGDVLTSGHAGTCEVVASKAAAGKYLAATSPVVTVTFRPPPPAAHRLSRALRPGRTMTVRVFGTHFYGRPLVVGTSLGMSAVVTHDSGHALTVRVRVARSARPGWHRMVIVFSHGQRTSLRYRVR